MVSDMDTEEDPEMIELQDSNDDHLITEDVSGMR